MWPWEHLAFGYVLLSLGRRLVRRARSSGLLGRPGRSPVGGAAPSDRAAVGLAVGTQLPDLVDKPLAWGLGVLPSGVSLAHSVFVAVPLAAAAVVWDRRAGAGGVGTAFAVGYLSHLGGDLLYPLAVAGETSIAPLLWPLVPSSGHGTLVGNVERFWTAFAGFLGTPRGRAYLLAELGSLAVAAALWVRDGTPGLRWWPRSGEPEPR